MPTQIGIGFSQNLDTQAAVVEAANQAKEKLSHGRIDFALVFSTIHHSPAEYIPILYKTLDQTKIVGSSTAGIILNDDIKRQGIAVLVITSEAIKFETNLVTHLNLQDIFESGKTLAKNTVAEFGQQHRNLFLFFADSLLNNLGTFNAGIKEHLENKFPIIGVGSSDNFSFQKTYQIFKNSCHSSSAAGVLIGGYFNMGISCQHGWKPLGKPRSVDSVSGHTIKTINGQNAFDMYKDYFDKEAETLKANRLGQINIRYPLGFFCKSQKKTILRNIISVDEAGGLVCQDKVPEDAEIHIMIGNKNSCLNAAEQAALEVKRQLIGKEPQLILVFESLLRERLLGRAAPSEMQVVRDILGHSAPVFGMYSYGEIFSPRTFKTNIPTYLQNGSIIIIAIN